MPIVFVSLLATMIMFILSIAFKVAGKVRLTIPLVYFLAISTVANKWASENEKLALTILGGLVTLCVLSWCYSLRKKLQQRKQDFATQDYISWQIQKAREQGIDTNTVTFDSNGHMYDSEGNQIIF
ncbi:MAG: hypothetical protein RR945_03250 [Erysipelotrichaceae bacterium]